MTPEVEYRLYPTLNSVFFKAAPLLVLFIGAYFLVVDFLSKGISEAAIPGFLCVGIAVVAFLWSGRMPTRIEWFSDGRVLFHSRLRRFEVMACQIRSVKPHGNMFGFLAVRTDLGNLTMANQFDEFHDFLARLKAANPAVELRGC